jgi:hypothetical protein
VEDFPFARKWKKGYRSQQKFILPKGLEANIKKPINAEIIAVGKKRITKLLEAHLNEGP